MKFNQIQGASLEKSVFLPVDHLADRRVVKTESTRDLNESVAMTFVRQFNALIPLPLRQIIAAGKKLLKRRATGASLDSRDLRAFFRNRAQHLCPFNEWIRSKKDLPGK